MFVHDNTGRRDEANRSGSLLDTGNDGEIALRKDGFSGDEDFTVAGSEVACEKCSRKFLAGEIR